MRFVWAGASALLVVLTGCMDSGSGESYGQVGSGSTTDDPAADTETASASSSASTATTTAATTTSPGPTSQGTATGTTAADSTGGESTGAVGQLCDPVPSCQASLPDVGPEIDWEHTESSLVSNSGSDRHRGYDMFYNPGETHWIMAKFAYGATDWDLSDEQVDLFLLEGCEGEFEPLGSVFTTNDGDHATVEGVVDSGGWVYFQMPRALPVGRHRIHMVVRGDRTRTDTYIEVVEPGTPMFLSDIDGTLTTSEWERLVDYLTDNVPEVNAGAPEAFDLLVERGYRPMYLTARPEFLAKRTYEFIRERGLPPGIIRTTQNTTGALGSAAVEYKSGQLAALEQRGLVPAFVFGNTDSDSEAYELAGIEPADQRFFVQFDDTRGGRRIEDYTELLAEFEALDTVCE